MLGCCKNLTKFDLNEMVTIFLQNSAIKFEILPSVSCICFLTFVQQLKFKLCWRWLMEMHVQE